jgi:hypothetical protein
MPVHQSSRAGLVQKTALPTESARGLTPARNRLLEGVKESGGTNVSPQRRCRSGATAEVYCSTHIYRRTVLHESPSLRRQAD